MWGFFYLLLRGIVYNDGMKKNILIIEDDAFLQQLYTDLLIGEGYEVKAVIDGTSGLEEIEKGHWDLILLDVMLPGMDGFTIVETLIKDNKKPTCPLVFMTNLDSNDDDKKKLQMGDAYWIKSNMAPPDFIANVKDILQNK